MQIGRIVTAQMQNAVTVTAQPFEITGNLGGCLGKAEEHGIGKLLRQLRLLAGNRISVLEQMKSLEGESIQVASGSPMRVWIPVAGPAEGALLARVFAPQASPPLARA